MAEPLGPQFPALLMRDSGSGRELNNEEHSFVAIDIVVGGDHGNGASGASVTLRTASRKSEFGDVESERHGA